MVGPFPAAWSWAEIGIFLPAEMTLDSILRKMRPIKLICKNFWEACELLPFHFWTVVPSVLGQLTSSSSGHCRTSLTVIILNLASLYATYLSTVQHSSIYDIVSPANELTANDNEIHKQLSNFRSRIDIVAVGWGDKNQVKGNRKAYDNRISQVINIIMDYTNQIFMYPSELTYPIHPANKNGWNEWEELIPYVHQ